MKKAVVALLAGLVISWLGCAGQQEYDTAERLYQLQQYDDAVTNLEKALRGDPTNEKYKALLAQVKRDAAREEYQRGLMFYDKRQIDQSLAALEKAVAYDPSYKEAEQAYANVKQRKALIAAVLTEIPGLLDAGKADEALGRIAEIESFSPAFPEIGELKTRALAQSTVSHMKQGSIYLQTGKYEEARKEFFVALNRTPNYKPAAEGIAAAEAQITAAKLVDEGKALVAKGAYEEAYGKFRQALKVVPGHRGALEAMIDVGGRWARALYDEGRALEEKGDFESLAEALRKYERAGALTERFADLGERVAALKKVLAGEFLKRAEQYEQLGQDYVGLALINYRMSLDCDGGQTEVSRKVAAIKAEFDKRRAFYIDIRSADNTSAGTSFGKALAALMKETALSSGMTNIFVVAPYETAAGSTGTAAAGGLPGRRLTIFTSVLSETPLVTGQNKPQIMRSQYKVGTRWALNPAYETARQAVADAEASLSDVGQRFHDAEDALRTSTPADQAARETDFEFERQRTYDEEDKVTSARKALAATPSQIEEDVYQPYDYKVFSVTMQAKVEVSLEIGDPDTGASKSLEVITGEASAESKYNEGVLATDSAGVTPTAQNLPTESELMVEARKNAATNAVEWLNKSLGQLSIQYYQRGKDLADIGNTEGASEYFYAFYLSTPDKQSAQAREAIEYVRAHTHLITDDEAQSPKPAAGAAPAPAAPASTSSK